jgi:hypothetical protein
VKQQKEERLNVGFPPIADKSGAAEPAGAGWLRMK